MFQSCTSARMKELSILGEQDKENKPTYHAALPYKEISGHIYHIMVLC